MALYQQESKNFRPKGRGMESVLLANPWFPLQAYIFRPKGRGIIPKLLLKKFQLDIIFMKISIVTPCYNAELYIKDTIESVVRQAGDFEIEYIIKDGGSSDRSIEIAKEYQYRIVNNLYPIQCKAVKIHILTEPDNGMYDAINKGFLRATGDIFAWLNADDIYLDGAFKTIVSVFEKYPEIFWVKGITSYIFEERNLCKYGEFNLYLQEWISLGIYGKVWYFIQQDSVFWRSSLWQYPEGIDSRLKYAGDYSLWIKFSQFYPLFSINAYISCFRVRKGQLSEKSFDYKEEMISITSSVSGKNLLNIKDFLFVHCGIFIKYFPHTIKQYLAVWLYKSRKFYIILFDVYGIPYKLQENIGNLLKRNLSLRYWK